MVLLMETITELIKISYLALGLLEPLHLFLSKLADAIGRLKQKVNKRFLVMLIIGSQSVVTAVTYLVEFLIDILIAFTQSFKNF